MSQSIRKKQTTKCIAKFVGTDQVENIMERFAATVVRAFSNEVSEKNLCILA